MKKTGSNFHRILNEEIIKFLNEVEGPSDAELKEKYKDYLDDPIYAAYVGTSAPAALASTTFAAAAAPESTAAPDADTDTESTADTDAAPAPPPTVDAFLNASTAVQDRAQDIPSSSIQRSPTRGGDSASEPEPASDTVASVDTDTVAPVDTGSPGAKKYENKKIDRCSLSFLLEGWEQDSTVKSQTQKSKKDLKLIDIIFDSSRVLSPHAQKYDRR